MHAHATQANAATLVPLHRLLELCGRLGFDDQREAHRARCSIPRPWFKRANGSQAVSWDFEVAEGRCPIVTRLGHFESGDPGPELAGTTARCPGDETEQVTSERNSARSIASQPELAQVAMKPGKSIA